MVALVADYETNAALDTVGFISGPSFVQKLFVQRVVFRLCHGMRIEVSGRSTHIDHMIKIADFLQSPLVQIFINCLTK